MTEMADNSITLEDNCILSIIYLTRKTDTSADIPSGYRHDQVAATSKRSGLPHYRKTFDKWSRHSWILDHR